MGNEGFKLLNHFYIHINIFHDPKTISEFICKETNCFRKFSNFNSFKKHNNNHIITPIKSLHP